jgi:hypothetical protein
VPHEEEGGYHKHVERFADEKRDEEFHGLSPEYSRKRNSYVAYGGASGIKHSSFDPNSSLKARGIKHRLVLWNHSRSGVIDPV